MQARRERSAPRTRAYVAALRRGARAAALSAGVELPVERPIPKHSYTLLNRESPEFVRFVNPGDYRVARESCGACHLPIDPGGRAQPDGDAAMLWGGAAYNNGILPYKRYILGEAYTREGEPAAIVNPVDADRCDDRRRASCASSTRCRLGNACRPATSSACSSAAGA